MKADNVDNVDKRKHTMSLTLSTSDCLEGLVTFAMYFMTAHVTQIPRQHTQTTPGCQLHQLCQYVLILEASVLPAPDSPVMTTHDICDISNPHPHSIPEMTMHVSFANRFMVR
jgi:hypothetical protein